MFLYGTTDPGFNGAQFEGNLDLEWAGAIAPKATIYYVYGPSAFTAIVYGRGAERRAGDQRQLWELRDRRRLSGLSAPSRSRPTRKGSPSSPLRVTPELPDATRRAAEPFATRGRVVDFPAVLPEVTGVGGTEFVEGTGTYWNTTNSTTFASAMSYIPEAAWNESSTTGSVQRAEAPALLYSRPVWQNGPGLPNDTARHVPDVALSAAGHDGILIIYLGSNVAVAGTSCATPSMAAIIALLNQYQVTNKFQKAPGLGNINPQLYRLAQNAPTAFHDVIAGNNIVQCAQGSPDCLSGSFGYSATVAYDMATGLGSVDANNLITMWNTATNGSMVTLSASATKATLNDTIQLTATVTPATGTGTPTGTVNFNYYTVPLGSATLVNGSATVPFPLYQIGGTGSATISAEYSGDGSFNPGGATQNIHITLPSGSHLDRAVGAHDSLSAARRRTGI